MNILFIGDIVGRPGRRSVQQWLPRIRDEKEVDFVLANAENAAGGLGATPEVLKQLKDLGVHAFTMGNHVWRKSVLAEHIDGIDGIVRPANYPPGTPGHGATVVPSPRGAEIGLVNVLGRIYMEPLACPFTAAREAVTELRQRVNIIIVDMHAEATAEKVAMGWHLDGTCTAVVGTHTHVQTADEWIMPQGTAYITDAGMCGPYHSVIGSETTRVLERFTTAMPRKFMVAKGPVLFSALLIEADESTGKATRIERILEREE